jgi:hypothetical protein
MTSTEYYYDQIQGDEMGGGGTMHTADAECIMFDVKLNRKTLRAGLK